MVCLAQLIVPDMTSNLRGVYVNDGKENKETVLSIEFLEKQCIFSKGMHCIEPETVCIAIAPQVTKGQCFYNNHTNELHLLTMEAYFTFEIFFFKDGATMQLTNNVDETMNNETCLQILAVGESVRMRKVG